VTSLDAVRDAERVDENGEGVLPSLSVTEVDWVRATDWEGVLGTDIVADVDRVILLLPSNVSLGLNEPDMLIELLIVAVME
jgi:hypothetical protein